MASHSGEKESAAMPSASFGPSVKVIAEKDLRSHRVTVTGSWGLDERHIRLLFRTSCCSIAVHTVVPIMSIRLVTIEFNDVPKKLMGR